MIKLSIPPQKHFDHYLFGSILYSENPSDIDIAIIYDKKFISLQDAIHYRHKLSEFTPLEIDTILLSKEEEIEVEFLSNAKHLKI